MIFNYFFPLNFILFKIIFNFNNSLIPLKLHFIITNKFTISASFTGFIFSEIWFCFAMRGVGQLASNFVTQMFILFRLSQG